RALAVRPARRARAARSRPRDTQDMRRRDLRARHARPVRARSTPTQQAPRSTGRSRFVLPWPGRHVNLRPAALSSGPVFDASLAELTAARPRTRWDVARIEPHVTRVDAAALEGPHRTDLLWAWACIEG